jgi:hypothetical protein
MANNSQKIIDSTRRVVYKFTGDAAETRVLKIDAGALAYALNANGYIMTGSDRKSNYGLALKKVVHSISGGYVEISTDGDAGNTIINLSGAGTMALAEGGDPISINCASYANSTGNIFLSMIGGSGAPANTYTVILDFRKLAYSYDQGQTADPKAFNV